MLSSMLFDIYFLEEKTMKYLSTKSMVPGIAILVAMVSTSISAQSTMSDTEVDQTKPFTITKVKYQAADEITDKSFSGYYYLNIAASGSTPTESTGDYSYGNSGCLYENSLTGAYDVNLRLPDGHRIVGMRYYFEDGNSSSSNAFIMRMDGDGTYAQLLQVQSTGDSGTYTSAYDDLSTSHFVDNARYSYVLRFNSGQIGSDQNMCGARLYMQATP